MKAFLVNGKQKNFADVIIENSITGNVCLVASYGFGIAQINRLISAFDKVLLIADTSHSRLSKNVYNEVVRMSDDFSYFTFKPINTHAKFALIDDEIIIFTSANLSVNRCMESYLIGKFSEIDDIEKFKEIVGDPDSLFKNDNKEFDFPDINFGSFELNLMI